jgi:hypothetical protein
MMGRYVHCLLCACVQFLYSSLHRFGWSIDFQNYVKIKGVPGFFFWVV